MSLKSLEIIDPRNHIYFSVAFAEWSKKIDHTKIKKQHQNEYDKIFGLTVNYSMHNRCFAGDFEGYDWNL